MATTVEWVFEQTMAIMDELTERGALADTTGNRTYKNRTVPILNILRMECFPFSRGGRDTPEGERPQCQPVSGMDSELQLDDSICQGILPYGLAAHLLLDEDPARAAYFNQRYEALLYQYHIQAPATLEQIQQVYGGVEYDGGARWG